jgi:hypothetical protein
MKNKLDFFVSQMHSFFNNNYWKIHKSVALVAASGAAMGFQPRQQQAAFQNLQNETDSL